MYFQKLEMLSQHKRYSKIYPIIDTLDRWLVLLPKSYRSKITPEMFAKNEDVSYKIVYKIFDELVTMELFQKRYAVKCVECGHIIYIAEDLRDLFHYINKSNENEYECSFCESIAITNSDHVFPLYQLADEPKEEAISTKKQLLMSFS